MPSEKRVNEYMQRHKIGDIFEDLMSKIVNAMPDDPRTFMCRILQRKSDYTINRTTPTSAQEKSSRRLTQSVDFSNKNRMSMDDFLTSKPSSKVNQVLNKLDDVAGDIGDGDDEELGYYSTDYEGAHRTDDRSEEMPVVVDKEQRDEEAGEEGHQGVAAGDVKRLNLKNQLMQKKLARMRLLEQQHQAQMKSEQVENDDSAEIDDQESDAVELLENAEDLENEGIKVSCRGSRLKTKVQDKDENVKISVCSRCARCIATGMESIPGSLEGRIINPGRAFDDTCVGDDCDFDSVSQASMSHYGASVNPHGGAHGGNDSSRFKKHCTPKQENLFRRSQTSTRNTGRLLDTSSPVSVLTDRTEDQNSEGGWKFPREQQEDGDNDDNASSFYGGGGVSKGTETSRSRKFQGAY